MPTWQAVCWTSGARTWGLQWQPASPSWSIVSFPGVSCLEWKEQEQQETWIFFFFPSNCRESIQSPSKARRPLHHGLQQRWQWRQLKPGEKLYNAIMRIVQDTGYAAYVATCRRIAHLGLFFVFLFFLSSPSLRSDHCDSFDKFLSNSEISLPDIYIIIILYFDMIIFFYQITFQPNLVIKSINTNAVGALRHRFVT